MPVSYSEKQPHTSKLFFWCCVFGDFWSANMRVLWQSSTFTRPFFWDFTGLFKCCSTNFKGCFCVVDVHTCQGTWLHHLSFSLKQDQSLPADSRYFCSSPQLLLGSWITDSSIHSSVWNKAGRIWSQPVYGEIMFFPLPSYRSNTAQWDIQCLIISSVTMPSACYETTGLWRS